MTTKGLKLNSQKRGFNSRKIMTPVGAAFVLCKGRDTKNFIKHLATHGCIVKQRDATCLTVFGTSCQATLSFELEYFTVLSIETVIYC